MNILIAPNAFKHSLSAIEAAKVIKQALDSLSLNLKYELLPIADGGDGTIDILDSLEIIRPTYSKDLTEEQIKLLYSEWGYFIDIQSETFKNKILLKK